MNGIDEFYAQEFYIQKSVGSQLDTEFMMSFFYNLALIGRAAEGSCGFLIPFVFPFKSYLYCTIIDLRILVIDKIIKNFFSPPLEIYAPD